MAAKYDELEREHGEQVPLVVFDAWCRAKLFTKGPEIGEPEPEAPYCPYRVVRGTLTDGRRVWAKRYGPEDDRNGVVE